MKANKLYILIIGSLLSFSTASAQEFKTNESISDQLKKGRVPGTKISTEVAAGKTTDDKEPLQKISVPLKQQLLNGTYPGLTVAKSATVSPAPAAQADKTILASDGKPVAATASKPVVMPLMQEEKKEEVPAQQQ